MSLVDTLYDILSGIGGTLFGVAVTTAVNWKRNRRLSRSMTDTQTKLDAMAAENRRLLDVVRDRENHILDLEKQILQLRPETPRKKPRK